MGGINVTPLLKTKTRILLQDTLLSPTPLSPENFSHFAGNKNAKIFLKNSSIKKLPKVIPKTPIFLTSSPPDDPLRLLELPPRRLHRGDGRLHRAVRALPPSAGAVVVLRHVEVWLHLLWADRRQ